MKLRNAVRRSTDPLVLTIVRIADESAVPLKAMPFLSDVYNQRLTIRQVDSISSNEDAYFRPGTPQAIRQYTWSSYLYR